MRRVLLALLLLPAAVQADDFVFNPALTQSDFRAIAEDVTRGLAYKAVGPSEASGLTGFSIGGLVTYAPTENPDSWKRATGEDVDAVGMTGLAARKGLPLAIDVGAFYATVPGTEAKVTGGELRWAPLPGSVALPAVALRLGFSKTTGVDDFDFKTLSYDVSASKGFGPITPYAGVGRVEATATPKGNVTLLAEEKFGETRLYAGARLTLGFLSLIPEVEKTGDGVAYNLHVGIGF